MSELLEFADKIWRGDRASLKGNPIHQRTREVLEEINDHVAFVTNFGNVNVVATDEGLVLIDCGSPMSAQSVFDTVRAWRSDRVHTIIYTHGHFDHVHGVRPFKEEALAKGWEPPRIVAHRNVANRFDRYRYTQGLNQVVNRRQFASPQLIWDVDFFYPDLVFDDALTLEIGGRRFELTHQLGETDDATLTYLPEDKIVFPGDLFIWVSPNCGNPQKVQRFAREWANALRYIGSLGAEILLPGHGLPIVGAARITQTMDETARYLEHLIDETVRLMNEGWRLSDIAATVTPPADLLERPYLQPVYDEPEFVVRNIWRRYAGWWDGNPAHLKPATEVGLAAALCDVVGAEPLVSRALTLIETGNEEDERVAGHLIEWAWLADKTNPETIAARQKINEIRANRATSTMAKGVFRWAVRESDGSTL